MSKLHPVSVSRTPMNLLMFMALLFVGWSPSPLRDLAARAGAEAAPTAGEASRPDRPEENKPAAADPSHSSRSFAFSAPTREWLRTSSYDTTPDPFLPPSSSSTPEDTPILCGDAVGRTTLPAPGRRALAHCGRAPPLPVG